MHSLIQSINIFIASYSSWLWSMRLMVYVSRELGYLVELFESYLVQRFHIVSWSIILIELRSMSSITIMIIVMRPMTINLIQAFFFIRPIPRSLHYNFYLAKALLLLFLLINIHSAEHLCSLLLLLIWLITQRLFVLVILTQGMKSL